MGRKSAKRGGPGVPVNVSAMKAAREAKGWSQKQLGATPGSSSGSNPVAPPPSRL